MCKFQLLDIQKPASQCCIYSDRHVGKTFSKSSSFIDYVRKSLKKLELDDSKVSH